MMARLTSPSPDRYSLPVTNSFQPTLPPAPPPPTSTAIVPLPPRAFSTPFPAPAPTYVQPAYNQPTYSAPPVKTYTPTTQSTQQQQTYYPIYAGQQPPNPLVPMHRPGAPAPAYYFNQYPGESTTARIIKNSILRGVVAILEELMKFFTHWTWPPVVV
jgi:hypothetical protein